MSLLQRLRKNNIEEKSQTKDKPEDIDIYEKALLYNNKLITKRNNKIEDKKYKQWFKNNKQHLEIMYELAGIDTSFNNFIYYVFLNSK